METLSQLIQRLKLIPSPLEKIYGVDTPAMTKNGYSYVSVYENEYTTFEYKRVCELFGQCYIVRGK